MVTAVLEARAGDWWFGTTKGLLRMRDGAREWFTMADGLPSDDVTSLNLGRDGTIWVGLRSGGMARFLRRPAASRTARRARDSTRSPARTAFPTTSSTSSTKITRRTCGWAPTRAA